MRIILALALTSSIAMAEGTFTTKYPLLNTQANKAEFGLYVMEPIGQRFEYQSWTGMRVNEWFTSYHHGMLKVTPRLKLGIGPAYETNKQFDHDYRMEAVLQWKLWQ